MNYLSHHFTARRTGETDPFFFAGNVMPDLLSHGEGRLQEKHIAEKETPFAHGVGLHLAADKWFHSHPAFREASAEASALLRSVPLSETPRRVFFLAHVFVEIALDGRLITRQPGIADDFYAQIESCGVERLVALTAELRDGRAEDLPGLKSSLIWFIERRYLFSYATFEGQAEALHRISRRAALPGFPGEGDQAVLAEAFAAFASQMTQWEDDLLNPPLWYNRYRATP